MIPIRAGIRLLFLLLLAVLTSCVASPEVVPREEPLVAGATLAQFVQGRALFNGEEFDGNGRRCATCHTTVERAYEASVELGLAPAEQAAFVARHATFDLDPEFSTLLFAADPADELFRGIDAQGGQGSDFSRLTNQGLVRVSIPVPSNILVEPIGPEAAANLKTLPDGTQVITVLRSAPNVTNMSQDPICRMWDCRVQGQFSLDTLSRQARGSDGLHGALGDHFQPGRAMTSAEGLAIGGFQAQLHTRVDLFLAANFGGHVGLPPCPPGNAAACRGREFFEDQPALASDMGHRGLCSMCHSGPGLNRTNEFNPVQPPAQPLPDGTCPCIVGGLPAGASVSYFVEHALPDGTCSGHGMPTVPGTKLDGTPACFHRLTNNVVAERNLAGLPEFWFRAQDPTYGEIEFRSPDLGHILQSGRICELAAACFLSPFSLSFTPRPGTLGTQSIFRIQSLWGISARHRFFHDNGASELEDVMVHSQDFFHETALGLAAFGDPNAAAFEISDQDAADMIAYVRAVGL